MFVTGHVDLLLAYLGKQKAPPNAYRRECTKGFVIVPDQDQRRPAAMEHKRFILKPALTLAFITPFLTELLSGNQSVFHFFFPPIFVFLLLIYGLPVLLIRDFWIRSGRGLPALFILGLAYGFYNEGVVAKTLLRSENVPLPIFDGYTICGINWAWAALIVPWHALQAVIAPIVLVSWLYPAASQEPWLSPTVRAIGNVIAVLAGSFAFLVIIKPVESPVYLLLFFAIIVTLFRVTRCASGNTAFLGVISQPEWREMVFGFAFYPLFVVSLCLLAAMRAPTLLILVVSTLWLVILLRFLTRPRITLTRMAVFCLSECLSASAITGLISGLHRNIPGCVVDLILSILFVLGLWRSNSAKATAP